MKLKWHKDDEVLVLRTAEMDRLRRFFEGLGLSFKEEKHGEGPRHYSCERSSLVFEI